MRIFSADSIAVATIWQEARGGSHALRVAVGEVIRNRMARRIFSDGTVEGTVLAAWQFSGWNPHDPNRIPAFRIDDSDPTVEDCLASWRESGSSNLTSGATHYFATWMTPPTWAAPAVSKQTVQIDNTRFFVVGRFGAESPAPSA